MENGPEDASPRGRLVSSTSQEESPMKRKLRKKFKRLRSELEKLREKHEPEICELVAVTTGYGPNMQEWGLTADDRWVSRPDCTE